MTPVIEQGLELAHNRLRLKLAAQNEGDVMSANLPESTELQREMADIRIREKQELIARTSLRLRENDERWMALESGADLHFNEGEMQVGQTLAREAYDLRVVSQRLRRDLNEMYLEVARLRSWLEPSSHGGEA